MASAGGAAVLLGELGDALGDLRAQRRRRRPCRRSVGRLGSVVCRSLICVALSLRGRSGCRRSISSTARNHAGRRQDQQQRCRSVVPTTPMMTASLPELLLAALHRRDAHARSAIGPSTMLKTKIDAMPIQTRSRVRAIPAPRASSCCRLVCPAGELAGGLGTSAARRTRCAGRSSGVLRRSRPARRRRRRLDRRLARRRCRSRSGTEPDPVGSARNGSPTGCGGSKFSSAGHHAPAPTRLVIGA